MDSARLGGPILATVGLIPSELMSVRKHKVAPDLQRHGVEEHVVVETSAGKLSKRDFTNLHKHRDMQVLTISNLKAESLDFLAEWRELQTLRLYGCTIADCGVLGQLKKLRELWYHTDRRKAPDLSFLLSLEALEELGVLYVPHLRSFPDLSACECLRRLTIHNCKRLVDVEAILRIPKLESFSIVATPQQPADLEPIMAMKTLRTMSGAFGSAKRDEEFQHLLQRHGLQYG